MKKWSVGVLEAGSVMWDFLNSPQGWFLPQRSQRAQSTTSVWRTPLRRAQGPNALHHVSLLSEISVCSVAE